MHRHIIFGLGFAAFFLMAGAALAEPPLPPKPARHLVDRANVVPAADEQRINAKLEQFERDTSNQVLVAVFAKIPDGTYLEDFTVKTAEAWGAGGKERDNGIILFVFIADRKMRIEVGYGLEGVVPDSIAKSIIEKIIQPQFKKGDYAVGIEQGVEAIFKATRGEYKGTGRTIGQSKAPQSGGVFGVIFILGWIIFIIWLQKRRTIRRGHTRSYGPNWWGPPSGGFGGGGGFSGGGGGGFSGGGGSFGGGGASGGW